MEGPAILGWALLPRELAALSNVPFAWFHLFSSGSRSPVFACRRYWGELAGPIGGNSVAPYQNFQATLASPHHLWSPSCQASFPSSLLSFFSPAVAVVFYLFSSVFHLSLHLFPSGINCGFVPYSLRRGGATHFYIALQALDFVMVQGRWKDQRTCRLYVDDARAMLVNFSLPPASLPLLLRFRSFLICGSLRKL